MAAEVFEGGSAGRAGTQGALVGESGQVAPNVVGRFIGSGRKCEQSGGALCIRRLRGSGVGGIVQREWERDGPDVGGVDAVLWEWAGVRLGKGVGGCERRQPLGVRPGVWDAVLITRRWHHKSNFSGNSKQPDDVGGAEFENRDLMRTELLGYEAWSVGMRGNIPPIHKKSKWNKLSNHWATNILTRSHFAGPHTLALVRALRGPASL
ncbi:hypothetical protein C8J57DRAFT_1252628 [Mycena rebaudengoi]|nr:hypothetical protein C8J57DRAFT_1252628 [Mycena rebaudengoi]